MKKSKRPLKPWQRFAVRILCVTLLSVATGMVWLLVTGHYPVWWTRVLVDMGLLAVWDAFQHFRLSRAFWNVLTAMDLPAYGEDPDEFWGEQ